MVSFLPLGSGAAMAVVDKTEIKIIPIKRLKRSENFFISNASRDLKF